MHTRTPAQPHVVTHSYIHTFIHSYIHLPCSFRCGLSFVLSGCLLPSCAVRSDKPVSRNGRRQSLTALLGVCSSLPVSTSPTVPPTLLVLGLGLGCPSSSAFPVIPSHPLLCSWFLGPVSGCDSVYMYMRRFWRLFDFLVFHVKVALGSCEHALFALGNWT